jgi:hypothetical protein
MRIEDSACREDEGSEKSGVGPPENSESDIIVNRRAYQPPRAQQRTSVVPDHGAVALAILAVTQDAEVDAAVGSDGDAGDDGRRERREQQQAECDEEQYR